MKAFFIAAIVSVVLGFAVYAARIAAHEDPPRSNSDVAPVVDGRVVSVILGETVDGRSYTSYCESDAIVTVRSSQVVSVVSQGAGKRIDPLTRIVEGLDTPPREGVDVGSRGTEYASVNVYWGEDGGLHVGCAPESISVYR
ncbi:MAG: hypothetical protein ONB14_12390 [candidate division KSB1 bacterium]|nr:hypothetical protein [candidate division KSB1 bacterium]